VETKIQTSMSSADEDYVSLLLQVMSKWYSKPREGTHVSDIIFCPRQKVFREIQPEPLSIRNLSMFSSGKSIHETIQLLFLSNRGRFEKEKYVEYENIIGSVDIYDQKKRVPIEFKTIRSSTIQKPKSFHVDQLKYYMAMLHTNTGYVLYQCLMHFEDEPFKIFRFSMSELEQERQLQKLVQEVISLDTALKLKDPSRARHIFFNMELNWLCRDCPYAIKCKQMRDSEV
jgi:CRISPR/Cas system-associated exonuclease Cas4 (RecB family)